MSSSASNPIDFRIYVASLSDYNGGFLHGVWIDFENITEESDIWDAVHAMLAASPYARKYGDKAEEWAIHDYELPGDMSISESEDFGRLWAMYEALQELEESEVEPFFIYLDYVGGNAPLSYDIENFRDAYQGAYDTEAEFAEHILEYTEEFEAIPERLRHYFDYASYARDLFIGGDYWMESGYVFANY